MGVAIMLGWLFGLIALVFFLVLRYDPEARRAPTISSSEISTVGDVSTVGEVSTGESGDR